MKIKVKYLSDVDRIEKIDKGDWIDLRASKDVLILKGEFALIPLGVAIQLPKNHEAHLVPRSSTFNKWGIIQTNSMGVIDESYCGDNDEWKMPVIAMRDTLIQKNDRICQFRVVEKMSNLEIEVVQELNNNDRGGFGSTGSK